MGGGGREMGVSGEEKGLDRRNIQWKRMKGTEGLGRTEEIIKYRIERG